MVSRDVSLEECTKVMADTQRVRALQDQLKAKLMHIIRTEFRSSYTDNHRVAMWCGSLIMQTVVGEFAQQLREHFEREGESSLQLYINGLPVSFVPNEQVTNEEPVTAAASAVEVTETEIDAGLSIGVVVVVLALLLALVAAVVFTLLRYSRHKRKESYYANSGMHRSESKAVTIVVNPLTLKVTENGEEDVKDSFGIEMSEINNVLRV